jgi:hypothetical protein
MRSAALLVLLFASAAQGEVFLRVPRTAGGVLSGLGGDKVYETAVQVNGAAGTLEAYSFTGATAPEIAARAARQLGLPAPSPRPGGAVLTRAENGKVCKVLVLPSAGGRDQCVALAIEQREADASQSKACPPVWPEAVPAFDATPVFTAVSEKTHTTFLTAEMLAPPGASASAAVAALTQAGYGEATPKGASCRIFSSGRKQAVLFAEQADNGKTHVSLIVREGS